MNNKYIKLASCGLVKRISVNEYSRMEQCQLVAFSGPVQNLTGIHNTL